MLKEYDQLVVKAELYGFLGHQYHLYLSEEAL